MFGELYALGAQEGEGDGHGDDEAQEMEQRHPTAAAFAAQAAEEKPHGGEQEHARGADDPRRRAELPVPQ